MCIRCENGRTRNDGIWWNCSALEMSNEVYMGQVEVECEGYDSANDQYVLEGSCGLYYHLFFRQHGTESTSAEEFFRGLYRFHRSHLVTTIGIVFLACLFLIAAILGIGTLHAQRVDRLEKEKEAISDEEQQALHPRDLASVATYYSSQ